MNVEAIVRFCMWIKYEVETALKARVWFSFMEYEDNVAFNIQFVEINYRVPVNVSEISERMHRGESAKEIGKTVSDIALSKVISKLKNSDK